MEMRMEKLMSRNSKDNLGKPVLQQFVLRRLGEKGPKFEYNSGRRYPLEASHCFTSI